MAESISENVRNNIWDEKLTQELNYRYFSCIGERITRYDSIIKYLLALTSISTVLFWQFIDPTGNIWKWLSATSSIIAVVNLTSQYQKKIDCIIKLKSFYLVLWKNFDELWLKIQSNTISTKDVIKERKKLLDSLGGIEKEDTFHIVDKRLVKRLQYEVNSNNLRKG
jgi:hypothetical protein